jgi:hypothetical protein
MSRQPRLNTTEQRHMLPADGLKHRVEIVHLLLESAGAIERIGQPCPPAIENHDPSERREPLPAANKNRILPFADPDARPLRRYSRYPAALHQSPGRQCAHRQCGRT